METQYVDTMDQTPTIQVNILGTRPPFRRIQYSTKKIHSLKDGPDLINPILDKCPSSIITSLKIVQPHDPSWPSNRCRTDNPMFKQLPVNEDLSVVRFLQHTTAKGLSGLRAKLSPNDVYEIAQSIGQNGGCAPEAKDKMRKSVMETGGMVVRKWHENRAKEEKEHEEKERRNEEAEERRKEVRVEVEGSKNEEADEKTGEVRTAVECGKNEKGVEDDHDADDVISLSDDEDYVMVTQEDICA